MSYIKRRREINRRAAAKSRARLKERAARVKRMYYEAKSVNTQLVYRHKQLEREKKTLEAAWSAHKRLHSDAGLDLSETDICRSLQTSDVSSSVSQPASVRQRSHSAPQPLGSMRTELLGLPRCPATPRQVHRCEVASNASSIAVQGRMVSDAAFGRPNHCESADGWTTKRPGGEQPASPDEPSSPTSLLYCIDESSRSAVFEPSSTAFDADQLSVDASTSPAIDEDDLDSLFGGDEWWASDQSWRWQCGSPDEAPQRTQTRIAFTSPSTSADSFSTVDLL